MSEQMNINNAVDLLKVLCDNIDKIYGYKNGEGVKKIAMKTIAYLQQTDNECDGCEYQVTLSRCEICKRCRRYAYYTDNYTPKE